MLNKIRKLSKKVFWTLDAQISAKRFPVQNDMYFIAVTGTDGKTTTCNLIYELAKSAGFNPLLITTVGTKFGSDFQKVYLSSNSFFAYSIKKGLKNLKSRNWKGAVKSFSFLDKQGFENSSEEHRTTPLASEIRKIIQKYQREGADFIILEVTSHAIDQKRITGLSFDAVAFTNITYEHLDYHGNWKKYASTKARLIDHLKPYGTAILNRDDKDSFKLLKKKVEKSSKNKHLSKILYSIKKFESIKDQTFFLNFPEASNEIILEAAAKTVKSAENHFRLNIFGDYNVYNALAALGVIYSIKPDISIQAMQEGLLNLKKINGRMNFISQNPTVIVDFAHTPNALKQALLALQKVRRKNSKLWCIFGCAGLRDFYKRPQMGEIAYQYSDNILITAEDPRTESLYDINNQIISGFQHKKDDNFIIHTFYPEIKYKASDYKNVYRFDEPNPNSRKNAIKFAIENADDNDIIVIFGKGHEKSIAFGETEHPWSDKEIVAESLEKLKIYEETN